MNEANPTTSSAEKDFIDFEQGEEPPVVPARRPVPPNQQRHRNDTTSSNNERISSHPTETRRHRSRSPPPYASNSTSNYNNQNYHPNYHPNNQNYQNRRHPSRNYNQFNRPPPTSSYRSPPPPPPHYNNNYGHNNSINEHPSNRTGGAGDVLFFSLKSEVYSIIAQAKCNGNWPARQVVADRIMSAAAYASRVYLLLSMETAGYFMAAALVDLPRANSMRSGPGEKYSMIPLRIVELADVPFGMVRVPEEYTHDRGTMRDGIELDPAFGYEVLEAMKRLSIRLY